MFKLGVSYTRKQIHAQVRGSIQSYLPHIGGRVVAACLRLDTNPEAPNVILAGMGDDIEHAAELLCAQHVPVPTFLKRDTGKWEYKGEFEVERWSQKAADVAEKARESGRADISRVIFMTPTRASTSIMPTDQMASHEIQTEAPVGRNIWIFGNPDKSELGFPMPGHLTQFIKDDVFDKGKGRYHHTLNRNADVIVLSRDGLAYGHFDIDDKVKPDDADHKAYPPVKCVYLVRKSTLYNSSVPLSSLANPNIHFGHRMTEEEFRDLQRLAGGTTENHNFPSLPQSPLELERVLREVQRRLGQSDFKKRLIFVYNARCAVSGCDAVEALEAAHIAPYSVSASNDPSNGLLLRADIHTLFDRNLIGIDPESLTVAVGTVLKKTSYCDLHGKQLALPADPAARPNAQALGERWQRFSTR